MSQGRVDGWRYTRSGYQITTIDGVIYATLFDLTDPRLKGLNEGVIVEFEMKPPDGQPPYGHLPYAKLLRVVR